MLERNFERITIALVALLFFLGGCATWQETTRLTITISEKAATAAYPVAAEHYKAKCSQLAIQARENGCTSPDFAEPACNEMNKCLEQANTLDKAFTSFFQAAKMGLIAITLGDKQAALQYVEKATQLLKHVYQLLRTWLPDKIPSIPILSPEQPTTVQT